MKHCKYFLIMGFCLLLFKSCKTDVKSKTNSIESHNIDNQVADVKVVVAKEITFHNEILSNGHIYAFKKADLSFRVNEILKRIYFKNGEYVKKGDIIATLNNFELLNRLEQSKAAFYRAELDLKDALIGQGYELKDSVNIPEKIMKTTMLRSGYHQAKASMAMAEFSYKESIMIAPMSGLIANMFSQELNRPNQKDQFCSIIDASSFKIEFPILEAEISKINKQQKVEVSPFFNNSIKLDGFIEEINPVVEENGMVRVYAKVYNKQNLLYHGMNVRICIKQKIEKQLVVPKKAVTNRSDKDVIFTVSGGLAKWNYVSLGEENSNYYTVSDGISIGDSVIIEGNTHLANLAKVRVLETLIN